MMGMQIRFKKHPLTIPLCVMLVAIGINYLGDFGFSYTVAEGTFFNGSWVDYLFTTSLYMINLAAICTLSILQSQYPAHFSEQSTRAYKLPDQLSMIGHFFNKIIQKPTI